MLFVGDINQFWVTLICQLANHGIWVTFSRIAWFCLLGGGNGKGQQLLLASRLESRLLGAAIAPALQNEFACIYVKCWFTVGYCCKLSWIWWCVHKIQEVIFHSSYGWDLTGSELRVQFGVSCLKISWGDSRLKITWGDSSLSSRTMSCLKNMTRKDEMRRLGFL